MLSTYTKTDRKATEVEMKPPTVYSVVSANSSPFVSTDVGEATQRYNRAVANGVKDIVVYETSPEGDVTTHTPKPHVCPTCNQIDANAAPSSQNELTELTEEEDS